MPSVQVLPRPRKPHHQTVVALPPSGSRVSLARRWPRRTGGGLVLESTPDGLRIELDESFPAGPVELEWVDPAGLASVSGRVRVAGRAVEVAIRRQPVLIQRREHIRVPAALPVTAWSLLHPTRLLAGTTINISQGGALIDMPNLPPAASSIDLRISLPDRPLSVRGRIVRRTSGSVVGIAFDVTTPDDGERLVTFVLAQGRQTGTVQPSRSADAPQFGSRVAALVAT